MLKILKITAFFVLLTSYSFFYTQAEGITQLSTKEYGVFLGLNKKDIKKDERHLLSYKILVLEAEECSEEMLSVFRNNEQKVFAYINIGSLETYRSYYKIYEKFLLDTYEDWPDEYWIDVSQKEWQDFITEKLAKKYKNLGFYGFFIDNIDVYYQYPTKEIYEGLVVILTKLKKSGLKIIINGGDVFLNKLMDTNVGLELFDGVNQECVFTSINFKKNTYGVQSLKERRYFDDYLQRIKQHKKMIFLLEYGASKQLQKEIADYCKKKGFIYFISKDKTLKKHMN